MCWPSLVRAKQSTKTICAIWHQNCPNSTWDSDGLLRPLVRVDPMPAQRLDQADHPQDSNVELPIPTINPARRPVPVASNALRLDPSSAKNNSNRICPEVPIIPTVQHPAILNQITMDTIRTTFDQVSTRCPSTNPTTHRKRERERDTHPPPTHNTSLPLPLTSSLYSPMITGYAHSFVFFRYIGSIDPRNPTILAALDYDRVRVDLAEAAADNRVLLLQALRWRLTKSRPGKPRHRVLQTYIQNDILCCTDRSLQGYENLLEELLLAKEEEVQIYATWFVNTIASESAGRSYLLQYPKLVSTLCSILFAESEDTLTRQNALGALQKVSLRRKAQEEMIRLDMIKWLVGILGEMQLHLSEYTIEYSTALLMNLSLRTSGKIKCEDPELDILQLLNGMLEHENIQVRAYINGTLYSVLSRQTLKERAKEIALTEMLTYLQQQSDETIAKQLQFIAKQLDDEPDDKMESDDEQDEEEEEEDDDEDDEDETDYMDEDDDEVYTNEHQLPQGEELLCAQYLANTNTAVLEAQQVNIMLAVDEQRKQQRMQMRASGEIDLQQQQQQQGSQHAPLHRPTTPRNSSRPDDPFHTSSSIPRTPPNGVSPARNPYQQGSNERQLELESSVPRPSRQTLAKGKAAKAKSVSKEVEGETEEDLKDLEEEYMTAFASRSRVARTPQTGSQMARDNEFLKGTPSQGRGRRRG
eukprot:TRINITY_DN482_c0_g1_i1.p2 TRINITY_DN482_c0_g1~~TRINITY_DN482_c0_g1_i1.p2  ORF type:complete len:699 (-),score=167.40 TRINITY_DN482_c0_g1_i1:1396-3492(-)